MPKRIKTHIFDRARISLLRHYLHGRNRKNAVFIWIPKTAGKSIYSCLDAPKLKTIHRVTFRFAGNGIVTFGHMDYAKLLEEGYISRRFDESAYKFAFVRNPYDRAVSLYSYLRKMGKLPAEESFLAFCCTLREKGCNPIGLYHEDGLSQCNPQVRWIENVDMNFIGRFESIEEDSDEVFSHLGLQGIRLPRLNTSNRSHYRDYYCSESKEIVERFYEEDFRAFGYTYER